MFCCDLSVVRVCSVVLRRTVVGVDRHFDNLSGSHHQNVFLAISNKISQYCIKSQKSKVQDGSHLGFLYLLFLQDWQKMAATMDIN